MSGSIINHIIDKYLSSILEINPEKTKSNLWSGKVELFNLKFKKEIFSSINLPFLELVDGHIGKLELQLQLPRFYLYPINAIVENVFFYAKQKDINNSRDKEKELMQNYKKAKLKNFEELAQNVEELKGESPTLLNQIINNLHVEVKNVIFRFDDSVSYKGMNFSLGLILNSFKIKPVAQDFNENSVIKEGDIRYKLSKIEGFSVFLDYSQKYDDIDYQKKICFEENQVDAELKKYLKRSLPFYRYCLSELEVHSKDNNAHYYLLYNFNLTIKAAINEKSKKNKKEKINLGIEFYEVLCQMHLEHIKIVMQFLNYLKLKSLYQKGIAEDIYKKSISDSEKSEYIEKYNSYYSEKYFQKETKNTKLIKELESELDEREVFLSYETIVSLRKIGQSQSKIKQSIEEIDREIEELKGKWLISASARKEKIAKLTEKKEILLKKKETESNDMISEFFNDMSGVNIDMKNNLPLYKLSFIANKFQFAIKQNVITDLVHFAIEKLKADISIETIETKVNASLGGISALQFHESNPIFKKIIYDDGEEDDQKNLLVFSFVQNALAPRIKMKLSLKTEKQLVIVLDLFFFKLLSQNILSLLEGIDFSAIEGTINKEIIKTMKKGYSVATSMEGQSKNAMDIEIDFKSPKFVIPQAFLCTNEVNQNAFILSFGNVKLRSDLLKETPKNCDLITTKERKYLYDKYIIEVDEMNTILAENYDADFKTEIKGEKLVKDVKVKTVIEMKIEPQNTYFESLSVNLNLSDILISFNERKLYFFIIFLEYFTLENNEIRKLPLINSQSNKLPKKEEKPQSKSTSEEKNVLKSKNSTKSNIIDGNAVALMLNVSIASIKISLEKTLSNDEYSILKNLNLSESDIHNKPFLSLSFNSFEFHLNSHQNGATSLNLRLLDILMIDQEAIVSKECTYDDIYHPTKSLKVIYISQNKKGNNKYLYIDISMNQVETKIKGLIEEINFYSDIHFFSKVYNLYSFYSNFLSSRLDYINSQYIDQSSEKITGALILVKNFENKLQSQKQEEKSQKEVKDLKYKNSIKIPKSERLEVDLQVKQIEISFVIQNNEIKFAFGISLKMDSKSENQNIYVINEGNNILISQIYSTLNKQINFSLNNFYGVFIDKKIENYENYFIKNFEMNAMVNQFLETNLKYIFNNVVISTSPLEITCNFIHIQEFMEFLAKFKEAQTLFSVKYESQTTNKIKESYPSITSDTKIAIEDNDNDNIQQTTQIAKIHSNLSEFNTMINVTSKISDFNLKIADYYFGQFNIFAICSFKNIQLLYINDDKLSNRRKKDKNEPQKEEQISYYQNLDSKMNIEMKYLNLHLHEFESFLEPVNINFLYAAENKFDGAKIELRCDKMINVNFSSNVLKTLFKLKTFYSHSFDKENKTLSSKDSKDRSNSETTTNEPKEDKQIPTKETFLKFKNFIGVPILFWFNKNDNLKYILKPGGEENAISISKEEYEQIIKKDSKNRVFSFYIENYNGKCEDFDFSFNHIKGYQIKGKNNSKIEIKVKTEIDKEMYRSIIIFPAVTIYNNTPFDLFIKNTNDTETTENSDNIIKEKLHREKLQYLPITLFECEVYIEKDKETNKIRLPFSEFLNIVVEKKENPKVLITFQKEKFYLDVQVFKSTEPDEKNSNNKYGYLYFEILISLPIYIINKSPMNIEIQSQNATVSPCDTKPYLLGTSFPEISAIIRDLMVNGKCMLSYPDNPTQKFRFISVKEYSAKEMKGNFIMTLKDNATQKFAYCCVSTIDREKTYLKDVESYLEEAFFAPMSIVFTFYFEYFITNRTNFDIEIIPSSPEIKFQENDLFLPKKKYLCCMGIGKNIKLKSNEFELTDKFLINTPGIEEVFDIKFKGKRGKSKLAALMKISTVFSNSKCVIIQNKYVLYNKLGFDLEYRQYLDKNEFGPSQILKNEEETEVILNKLEKKNNIQIGKNNEWSRQFDIENIEQFDLCLPIEKNDVDKVEYKNNIFTPDDLNYFIIIRCIIHTMDEGTVYIIFTFPEFPIFQIYNKTSYPVEIQYHNKFTINPGKIVPLISYSHLNSKKKLQCIILGSIKELSFESLKIIDHIIKKKDKEPLHIQYHIQNVRNNLSKKLTIIDISSDPAYKKLNNSRSIQPIENSTEIFLNLKGIGISLIDDVPRENLYISFYGIYLNYKNTHEEMVDREEFTNLITLKVKNIQIDYCFKDSFPNIFVPRIQNIPATEKALLKEEPDIPEFLQIYVRKKMVIIEEVIENKKSQEVNSLFPEVEIILQEFNFNFDHFVFNSIMNLINNYLLSFNKNVELKKKEEKNLECDLKIPAEEIINMKTKNPLYAIEHALISAIKVNLTFRFNYDVIKIKYVLGFLENLLKGLASLTSISNLPLKFNELLFENILIDFPSLIQILINHYKTQGLRQAYKVLLGIDILGNPLNLVSNIGTGFKELVNEPRKGFMKGPVGFGKGIVKGVGSFVSNVVTGTMGSVSSITGSLYTTTKLISGDKKKIAMKEEEEKPTGLFSGTVSGFKKGFGEIAGGVTGIFTKPVESAKEEGVTGFFKGVGKGVVGAVVSPVSAVLQIGNQVATGAANSDVFKDKKTDLNLRFREVRIFNGSIITPSNLNEVQIRDGVEISVTNPKLGLKISKKIEYFENYTDKSNKEFEGKNQSMIIITDILIKCIYKYQKDILTVDLKQIKSCKLEYRDKIYSIILTTIKGKTIMIKMDSQETSEDVCRLINKLIKGNK